MKTITLEELIPKEEELTNRARFDIGDTYELTKELFVSIQCLKSFSRENEVIAAFDSQILSGFFNAILNTVRRHTNVTHLIIRQVIENMSLFIYSMEARKFSDYNIEKVDDIIVDFNENVKYKVYDFVLSKYPDFSRYLEMYKKILNYYFSHANISNSQSNTTIIDDRIKTLFFDTYVQDYTRQVFLSICDLMILLLKIYVKLHEDYVDAYEIKGGIDKEIIEYERRKYKILEDLNSNEKYDKRFNSKVEEIINKVNAKYAKRQ